MISIQLAGEEQAAIACWEGRAASMVRFSKQEDSLYFFRLSVDPQMQGKEIGRACRHFGYSGRAYAKSALRLKSR